MVSLTGTMIHQMLDLRSVFSDRIHPEAQAIALPALGIRTQLR